MDFEKSQCVTINKRKDLQLLKVEVVWQKIQQICRQLSKSCGKEQSSIEMEFIFLMLNNWNPQFQQDFILKINQTNNQTLNCSTKPATQIFINTNLLCDFCGLKSRVVLQNICRHKYCRSCFQNYIPCYYKQQEQYIEKTLLPPCLNYKDCNKMISHVFVIQSLLLTKNRKSLRKFKMIVAKNFIQCQWRLKLIQNQNQQYHFQIERKNNSKITKTH